MVANAADINKRVLLGRNSDGMVVGRCLLALSRDGTIVTFQPYVRGLDTGFAAAARAFVRTLAARMHTVPATRGTIELLVASRWYDDGAEDVAGQLAFLEDGSPLRERLSRASAAEFQALLSTEVGAAPLRVEVLEELLRLLDGAGRADLVLTLLPSLERCGDLDPSERLRAARLARKAGDRGAARRVMAWFLVDQRWRDELTLLVGGDRLVTELIESGQASFALRVLRATAGGRGRDWMERLEPRQLSIAARAFEALQRYDAALRCYRRALERARRDTDLADECGERIAALSGG